MSLPELGEGLFWRIKVHNDPFELVTKVTIQVRQVRSFPWKRSADYSREECTYWKDGDDEETFRERVLAYARAIARDLQLLDSTKRARTALEGLLGDIPPDWKEWK